MSTTKDLGVAVRYSLSAHSLVFKVSVRWSRFQVSLRGAQEQLGGGNRRPGMCCWKWLTNRMMPHYAERAALECSPAPRSYGPQYNRFNQLLTSCPRHSADPGSRLYATRCGPAVALCISERG